MVESRSSDKNEETNSVDLGLHRGSLVLLMQAVSFLCVIDLSGFFVYLDCSMYRFKPWQNLRTLEPERWLFTDLASFCLGASHPSPLIFGFLSGDLSCMVLENLD